MVLCQERMEGIGSCHEDLIWILWFFMPWLEMLKVMLGDEITLDGLNSKKYIRN